MLSLDRVNSKLVSGRVEIMGIIPSLWGITTSTRTKLGWLGSLGPMEKHGGADKQILILVRDIVHYIYSK